MVDQTHSSLSRPTAPHGHAASVHLPVVLLVIWDELPTSSNIRGAVAPALCLLRTLTSLVCTRCTFPELSGHTMTPMPRGPCASPAAPPYRFQLHAFAGERAGPVKASTCMACPATGSQRRVASGGCLQVFTEVEEWVSREKFGAMRYPSIGKTQISRISEEICTAAANLAGQLGAKAILVYTHTGASAGYVSRRRPDCHILAITGAPPPPPPLLAPGPCSVSQRADAALRQLFVNHRLTHSLAHTFFLGKATV